jgi:predicted enzyme related to lactoylglutathione lyase
MARAKAFFADQLGLTPTSEDTFSINYRLADTFLALVPSESAGLAQYSLVTWLVDDIDTTKNTLENRGVVFERYDWPGIQMDNDIADFGTDRVAWFKDSEGNILAIAQLGSSPT